MPTDTLVAPVATPWQHCGCGLLHMSHQACSCRTFAQDSALPHAPLVALILSALLGLAGGALAALGWVLWLGGR